jgi:hypothetical protein
MRATSTVMVNKRLLDVGAFKAVFKKNVAVVYTQL